MIRPIRVPIGYSMLCFIFEHKAARWAALHFLQPIKKNPRKSGPIGPIRVPLVGFRIEESRKRKRAGALTAPARFGIQASLSSGSSGKNITQSY